MKQLIIIGEGQTEQEFCKDVLYSHFFNKGIIVHNPTIKKSKGGLVPWFNLKEEIENHLKSSPKAIVTTLIDFYGLKEHHNFPLWSESKIKVRGNERVETIEKGMHASIDESLQHRFIPYIQLYEFEALLFSDASIFDSQFDKSEILDYEYLRETLQTPPEEINEGPATAPSKRLEKIIEGYNKVLHGSLIAHVIGLDIIRGKCSRFNSWVETLENI